MKKIAVVYIILTRGIPLGIFLIVTSPIWAPVWALSAIDDYMSEKAEYPHA